MTQTKASPIGTASPLGKALSCYSVIFIGAVVAGFMLVILYNLFFEPQPITRDPNPDPFVCHGWKSAQNCGFFEYLGNLFGRLPAYLIIRGFPLYFVPFLLASLIIIFGLYWYFKKRR